PTAILCQPGVLEDRRERCTTAVRERIHAGLAIVRDESPDGHGLHRMGEDADRSMLDAGRGAEQDHSVLCAQLCRRLCHWSTPAASFLRMPPLLPRAPARSREWACGPHDTQTPASTSTAFVAATPWPSCCGQLRSRRKTPVGHTPQGEGEWKNA